VLCLLALGLLGMGCDSAAHSPPGPDKIAPPPASAPSAAHEPVGFAGEIVPAAAEPPAPPGGPSTIGRFSQAEDARAQTVFDRLRSWVSGRSGKLHAIVLDLESERALVLHRATEPVNPASNMKLLTAAAALDLLGPAFTFQTQLRGAIDAAGRSPHLVLEGGGDPGLSSADLFRLAQSAHAQGLRSVARLDVDQSLFETPFVPPAFEQQPREWAAFRAPISAAAVDQNTVTLNVAPSEVGEPARVWYEPPGVVLSQGSVETRTDSGDRVGWTLDPSRDPTRPLSILGGGLEASFARQRYTRRLDDPRRAAGLVLGHYLSVLGVQVDGDVGLAGSEVSAKLPRISYVASAPLSEVLLPLGKDSDNFTAEMVLVALSHASKEATKGPWSSARGASVLRDWLSAGGIPIEAVVIKNGSGLFDANRVTAETLALVLARMESRPEVFAEYLGQLAIYGTDGTLRRRMAGDAQHGRIRAKTGTLDSVDALSGYVLRPGGQRPLVFSLVVSGASGGHGPVRQALDRAVFEWATALVKASGAP
jgi:serine-type D-Ala-D-Ala carboxypeptidase/endopeptidase (penicillin-binding protein 4)